MATKLLCLIPVKPASRPLIPFRYRLAEGHSKLRESGESKVRDINHESLAVRSVEKQVLRVAQDDNIYDQNFGHRTPKTEPTSPRPDAQGHGYEQASVGHRLSYKTLQNGNEFNVVYVA